MCHFTRVVLIIGFLLGGTSLAFSKDMVVSDQDQTIIQGICDSAAISPTLNREGRAQIAGWCVSWARRVQAGQAEPAPSPPKKP